MRSQLPKVLHPILFRPMLHHVLDLAEALGHASISVVVGHGEEQVRASCRAFAGLQFFSQHEQRGTAHAVLTTEPFLKGASGDVLILSGDVPLLRIDSIDKLLRTHQSSGAALSFVTAGLAEPRGYGRVLRDASKRVTGIREEADCSEAERELGEVNAGIYCFRIPDLLRALARIGDHNRQREYYLTDTIALLAADGKGVEGVALDDPREMMGVNDRWGLAEVETLLQQRVNRDLMLNGVTIQGPQSVFVDVKSQVAPDTHIEAGCQIIRSNIGAGSRIEANVRLIDSRVAENCLIKQGSYIEGSEIAAQCAVGPYAHLRPGTLLDRDVKIGNFVEVKKSRLGKGSKAAHLSYIGDAEIGENVNIGCGFVTCNYDGTRKHATVIEDDVFVGSDSQTVAPVRVGRGSYVASGSTITRDVPPDSLAISRGKQVNKVGYASRFRPKK